MWGQKSIGWAVSVGMAVAVVSAVVWLAYAQCTVRVKYWLRRRQSAWATVVLSALEY